MREALPPDRTGVISLAVVFAAAVAAQLLTPSTAAVTTLIGAGALIAYQVAFQAHANRRVAQLRAADEHSLETHFVELDDTGTRAWCSHVEARYPWRDFKRATENAEFFLLTRGGGGGVAIPKRVVGDGAAELRERLAVWLRQPAAAAGHELDDEPHRPPD
jgi:hypothetical protein